MEVGIVDVDGHARKKKWGATIYPNLVLCKIAAWHRQRGDRVRWATPMYHFDIIYMAKVFNFSPDNLYIYDADKIVKGGTGYNIESHLPEEIDRTQPDYSIYPNVPSDTAYGFLTRGCPNHCRWCVVPRKEGMIRPYMDIDEIATKTRHNIVLMDNNILAAGDYAKTQLTKIIERGYHIDFNQAMDARLVTEEYAELLAKVKWIKSRIRFGCDTQTQIPAVERAMEMINGYGYKGEYFLYTMLNADFRESFARVNYWRRRNLEIRKEHKRNIMYPYAQPYRDPTNSHAQPPQWQKDMANWVNKKMIFETCEFADFMPRKGFKCKFYIEQFTK